MKLLLKPIKKFYRDNQFTRASFTDIKESFEEISGKDLAPFFNQWIDRTGAPSIDISEMNLKQIGQQYQLSVTLNQKQKEGVFFLNIPVAVYLENNTEVVWKNVLMNKKNQNFDLTFDQKPLKIEIDPEFNIMRLLDRKEVPASLSKVFGSKISAIIIPSS